MRRVLEERIKRLERWNPSKIPILCWREGDGYTVEGKCMSEEEFEEWAENVPEGYEIVICCWEEAVEKQQLGVGT